MTAPVVDIVCTTIGDGSFLKHYAAALAGAEDRARMIVIPDRKTPAALYAEVAEARAAGMNVLCPDLNEQEQFLASLGAPAGMFPWDTDHRRNIGYLMAWRDGADIMISVDDDNLPDDLWLAAHACALTDEYNEEIVSSSSGFWNPLSLIGHSPGAVYPRGYPYARRTRPGLIDTGTYDWSVASGPAVINAGLWSGEPDVDAITRLALRPRTVELEDSALLAADTWAPVNSQNTAIRRDVIPAYYFFRSGRFGDIYQGYLAQACARAIGHSVRFGTPVVTHARNDHDLLRDLQLELPDILILDGWLDWLTSLKPSDASYADAYDWLARELRDHAEFGGTGADAKRTFHSMASQMTQWLRLIRKIGD